MLNVCFSGHECGVLNMCSSELEIDRKRLVWLDMMLYGGVLIEPLDFAGRKAFYCIDNDYIYTEMRSKLKKFSKMLDDENDISIWYSSTYANDVLGMMWVIHYIRDKKMSVKVYDACKYFDVMLSYDDLPEKPEARILTDDEINDISEKWIRLVNENTGLRILENGEAVSKPVDYFDKDIFDILGSNEKTVCDIYGEWYQAVRQSVCCNF